MKVPGRGGKLHVWWLNARVMLMRVTKLGRERCESEREREREEQSRKKKGERKEGKKERRKGGRKGAERRRRACHDSLGRGLDQV